MQLAHTSEAHTWLSLPLPPTPRRPPPHPSTPTKAPPHAPHMQRQPLTTSRDAQHGTPRRPTPDEQDHAPHPKLARARGRTPHSSHTIARALRHTHPATAESMALILGLHQRSLPLLVGQSHHCPRTACCSSHCQLLPMSSRAAHSCACHLWALVAARHHCLQGHPQHSP